MNTLEERVRAATRAAADTVPPDSVPPLLLPPGDPARSRGGSRSSASVWSASAWSASAWSRRLAPLGAALAVVAVAIAMVTLGQTVHHSASRSAPGSSQSPALSAPGPVQAGPAVASYVAAGRVPRYLVSIESRGNPNFNPSYAVVRATVTGAVLATIAAPNNGTVVTATASAGDRTFVLDEQPWVPPQSHANQSFEPRTFILFRLDDSGQPGALTRLSVSVPGGALMTGFALSPDASQLAIAVEPDNDKADPGLQQIRVYSLATGAVRTWSADGTIGFGPDDARSLSWTGNERTLAFDWAGNGPGVHVGVRLLDLRSGGGDLLADSRQAVALVDQAPGPTPAPSAGLTSLPPSWSASPAPSASAAGFEQSLASTAGSEASPASSPAVSASVASPSGSFASPVTSPALANPVPSAGSGVSPAASPAAGPQPTCQEDSIITPDGTTIVCGAIAEIGSSVPSAGHGGLNLQRGAETEFFEFSAATGRVTRVLGHWRFGSVGALAVNVLWSDPSGSVLIGVIPDAGSGQVGVISGNKFTPLNMSPASASPFLSTW
ncbi:MAG TPA: hypothetical protein VIX15_13885 [Streptosporangiaceae bacterium]